MSFIANLGFFEKSLTWLISNARNCMALCSSAKFSLAPDHAHPLPQEESQMAAEVRPGRIAVPLVADSV